MKVATLRLEIDACTATFFTLKTSGAISIFMSPFTFTWQASRQPRLASPREM